MTEHCDPPIRMLYEARGSTGPLESVYTDGVFMYLHFPASVIPLTMTQFSDVVRVLSAVVSQLTKPPDSNESYV